MLSLSHVLTTLAWQRRGQEKELTGTNKIASVNFEWNKWRERLSSKPLFEKEASKLYLVDKVKSNTSVEKKKTDYWRTSYNTHLEENYVN